jgi:hypothetical protein
MRAHKNEDGVENTAVPESGFARSFDALDAEGVMEQLDTPNQPDTPDLRDLRDPFACLTEAGGPSDGSFSPLDDEFRRRRPAPWLGVDALFRIGHD